MNGPLRFLLNPPPGSIPADFLDFLRMLGGPTVIRIDGLDPGHCRVFSTLLHGNEPSGARALHAWLREGAHPRISLLCFVASVEAALHEAPLKHRFLPSQRDFNRCFRAPFDDAPGRVAGAFLHLLRTARPECLLDVHNTSGLSPAFSVAAHEGPALQAFASRFCRHMVITDLRLGALMELSADPCPALTLECGAPGDAESDRIARSALQRLAHDADILGSIEPGPALELYRHPVRLELEAGTQIAWAGERLPGADLCVRPDLERFNFCSVSRDTPLAWLGPRGLAPMRVRNGRGDDVCAAYFREQEGRLYPAQALRFFMVTSSAQMALGDCLLYAAAEREHTQQSSSAGCGAGLPAPPAPALPAS